MIKVSVIVPVYNVELYLAKCLESLLTQTLPEIEIIVVNDGTKDNSQQIIDEYSKASSKIRGLKKENGGLSDARNYGMQYAQGEYIGFVDGDDYVDSKMYETLYKKAKEEGSDVVECNLHHTYPDREDTEIGKEIYDKHQMLMFGRSVVWNKIYKREWLKETGVTFPVGLIYEDVAFYSKLVPHIRGYSYIEPAFVHYVQRSNSLNNVQSLKTLDILKILAQVYDYYEKGGFLDQYREALEFLYVRILLCSSFLRMCRIEDKKQREEALHSNFGILNETFPNWRKNRILKKGLSKKLLFVRTVTKRTYPLYCRLFPFIFKLRGGNR